MSGNVGEWCQDSYGSYNNNPQTNPITLLGDSKRVSRGGGWNDSEWSCRSLNRFDRVPSTRAINLGFRLAL